MTGKQVSLLTNHNRKEKNEFPSLPIAHMPLLVPTLDPKNIGDISSLAHPFPPGHSLGGMNLIILVNFLDKQIEEN